MAQRLPVFGQRLAWTACVLLAACGSNATVEEQAGQDPTAAEATTDETAVATTTVESEGEIGDIARGLPVAVGESIVAFDGLVTTVIDVDAEWQNTPSGIAAEKPPKEGTTHVGITLELSNPTEEPINVYYDDYDLRLFAPDGSNRPSRKAATLSSLAEGEGIEFTEMSPGTTLTGVVLYQNIEPDSIMVIQLSTSRIASLSGSPPSTLLP